MKRIYLLRHAKASWELAGQLDYERGLTERGHADCELMAATIAERRIAPELILCSGARRARETLAGVASALPKRSQILYEDAIYRASALDLLRVLSATPAAIESVMLVGHNPSIHDLAVEIAAEGRELDAMAGKFPTAALAELQFESEWHELAADSCELVAFIRPKQIKTTAGWS